MKKRADSHMEWRAEEEREMPTWRGGGGGRGEEAGVGGGGGQQIQ